MKIDLSKFTDLSHPAAERLAGHMNVEFHPIVCEHVQNEICLHVSPMERATALAIAEAEARIPSGDEVSRVKG